jgi:hypothetical protein
MGGELSLRSRAASLCCDGQGTGKGLLDGGAGFFLKSSTTTTTATTTSHCCTMVRITTWNVNGIRNPFGYEPWRKNRTFGHMFDVLETDIIIMQELKIQRKDLTDDMVLVPGWDCYFSLPKHKKGMMLPLPACVITC